MGEWRDHGGDGRGGALAAQRGEDEGAFLLGVETEQAVDVALDEAGDEARGYLQRGGRGEEIGEKAPGIPEEVPVAARLVLPRVAPVDRGGDHRGRGGGDRVVGRGYGEGAAEVAGAQ